MDTPKRSFSSFSTDDLQKAKEFYHDTLGLEVEDNPMGLIELHLANGTDVLIYPKNDHVPATFTVLNFVVDDVGKVMDDLSQKGVRFEHYNGKLQTDEKGILRNPDGSKIAWFKDPAGNVLSVIEEG